LLTQPQTQQIKVGWWCWPAEQLHLCWRIRRSFSVRHSLITSTLGLRMTIPATPMLTHGQGAFSLQTWWSCHPSLHVYLWLPWDSTLNAYGLSKRSNEITRATFDLVTSCLHTDKAEIHVQQKGKKASSFIYLACVNACPLSSLLLSRSVSHMIARYASLLSCITASDMMQHQRDSCMWLQLNLCLSTLLNAGFHWTAIVPEVGAIFS